MERRVAHRRVHGKAGVDGSEVAQARQCIGNAKCSPLLGDRGGRWDGGLDPRKRGCLAASELELEV